MHLSFIFLLIFITFIGLYSFVLLNLNTNIAHLDLIIFELDIDIGTLVLVSFLTGISITLILEIIYFSYRKKNRRNLKNNGERK